MVALVATLALIAGVAVAVGTARRSRGPAEGGPLLSDPGLVKVDLALRPGAEGAVWGLVELYNTTRKPIILDDARVVPGDGALRPSRSPYVFDSDRLEIAGARGLVAEQLPMPDAWPRVPKHDLKGFVVAPHPGAPVGGHYVGPQLMFEFSVPADIASINGVVVDYRVGDRRYRKTFPGTFRVCPRDKAEKCRS